MLHVQQKSTSVPFVKELFDSIGKAGLARTLQPLLFPSRELIHLKRKRRRAHDIPIHVFARLLEALGKSEATADRAESRPRQPLPRLAGGAQDMRRAGDNVLGACCSTSHGSATRRSQGITRGIKATPKEKKGLPAYCRVPWLFGYTEPGAFSDRLILQIWDPNLLDIPGLRLDARFPRQAVRAARPDIDPPFIASLCATHARLSIATQNKSCATQLCVVLRPSVCHRRRIPGIEMGR